MRGGASSDGILLEHGPLERLELRPRLESEARRGRLARVAVRSQGVRLPAGPVERNHQLPAEALAVGVLERPARRAPTRPPHGGRARDRRRSAPRARRAAAPPAGRPRPPRTARHRTRRAECRARAPGLRAAAPLVGPDRRTLGPRSRSRSKRSRSSAPAATAEQVAGRLRAQRRVPVAERLAEAGDVDLESGACSLGRRLAPELVDQPRGRNDPVCVKQQQSEHRALLRWAEIEPSAVAPHLETPEDEEVELGGRSGARLDRAGHEPSLGRAWRFFGARS